MSILATIFTLFSFLENGFSWISVALTLMALKTNLLKYKKQNHHNPYFNDHLRMKLGFNRGHWCFLLCVIVIYKRGFFFSFFFRAQLNFPVLYFFQPYCIEISSVYLQGNWYEKWALWIIYDLFRTSQLKVHFYRFWPTAVLEWSWWSLLIQQCLFVSPVGTGFSWAAPCTGVHSSPLGCKLLK